MGPGDELLTKMAREIKTGVKTINEINETTTSITLFKVRCHTDITCVFTLINKAPKIFVISTEPERFIKLSVHDDQYLEPGPGSAGISTRRR